jgi:hypothetical protein
MKAPVPERSEQLPEELRRHLQNIAVVLMSLHHWKIAAGHCLVGDA